MTATFDGVRMAKRDEGDAIFDFLAHLHEENGLFRLDPVKARQSIEDMLDPSRGVIGVIDGPNGIEASIGLYLTQWWYTTDPHLTEFWNFVRQDCRRSTHAKRLLEFAKWCADRLGIPLHVGIVTNNRVEAKQRLYRRHLKPMGAYFMWGVTPRLNVEMDAGLDHEADRVELLDAYHGAVQHLLVIDPNSNTSRKREATRAAMDRLKSVQAKYEAIGGA